MEILNALALFANFVAVPATAYGAQLALGALGVTLIFSILRFANFSHGELMSFGAMMVAADDPNGDGAPATVSRRRAARLAAVQALYELGVNGGDVEDIIIDYRNERPGAVFEGNEFAETDHDLFADVVRGVVRRNMIGFPNALRMTAK